MYAFIVGHGVAYLSRDVGLLENNLWLDVQVIGNIRFELHVYRKYGHNLLTDKIK